MKDVIDLKPCPFCGGEAQMQYHEFDGYERTYGVICVDCMVQFDTFFLLEEEAVKAWNSRVKS